MPFFRNWTARKCPVVLFLSECSALRELDCSRNQLVELDTTGLTLEILETAGNQRAIVPQPEQAGAYSYDLNNLPELEQDRITGWENASVKGTMPPMYCKFRQTPNVCPTATGWTASRQCRWQRLP